MPQELYEIRTNISQAPPSSVSLPKEREDGRTYLGVRAQPRSFSLRGEGADEGGLGGVQPDLESLHQRLDGYYRKAFTGQWQAYAINGAFSVIAGLISLLLPVLLDSGGLAYAGGVLLLCSALTLASTLSGPPPAGFAISLLLGLLYLPAGICLMLGTFTESISLIWLFSAYFVATGIATLLFAASCRRCHYVHWEWLAVSGVLNLELALIALSRLPEDFIWSLIIFLGLDLIVYGSALLGMALTADDSAGRRPSV